MTEPSAGAWDALRSIEYRRLFVATAIVIFGVMGQTVARGWLAREITGSNAGLGGVMLAFGASMLLATPLGGVAADRLNKRTVLVYSVAMLGVSALLLGVAVVADVVTYWMLLVASALQAAAFAFYLPTRIAYITELVEPPMVPDAVVLAQMAIESVRVVAPALAGVMMGVSWFGVGGVYLLGAATAAVAVWYVTLLPPTQPAQVSTRSPIGELVDAARYIRRTHGLALISLTTIGVVMVGFPYLTFLPTMADERFEIGAGGYGVMAGSAGFGAVLGGVVNSRFPIMRLRPWRTIAISGGMFGVGMVGLGAAHVLPLSICALIVLGGSALIFQTTSQSLMLTLSAYEYHGRLQSMVVLGFSGFGLAALPLGVVADSISLPVTLALMGVAIGAIVVAFATMHVRHRGRLLSVELG